MIYDCGGSLDNLVDKQFIGRFPLSTILSINMSNIITRIPTTTRNLPICLTLLFCVHLEKYSNDDDPAFTARCTNVAEMSVLPPKGSSFLVNLRKCVPRTKGIAIHDCWNRARSRKAQVWSVV